MAAVSAIQRARPDTVSTALPSSLELNFFQRGLAISDLDAKDSRYPPLPSDKTPLWPGSQSQVPRAHGDLAPPSEVPKVQTEDEQRRSDGDRRTDPDGGQHSSRTQTASQGVSNGGARHTAEGIDQDDSGTTLPLVNSNPIDSRFLNESFKSLGESLSASQLLSSPLKATRDIPQSLQPSGNRQVSYPVPDGSGPSRLSPKPLSTTRAYGPTIGIPIPISSNPRAYAQHPTFITPAAAPDPINPILSPIPIQPPEEVCVECAMRDQDMADVIVTGPGVWDRESDVLYEELLRREEDEEATGILHSECSSRPRARGGRLIEQNLKLWNAMASLQPMARQQTLDQYVKAQRSLLEAEALAHAQAVQESKQLENSVKDTIAQIRRSVYDPDGGDDNAFKLKPLRSTIIPNGNGAHHIRASSRDITLLQNGLIVEHVNVRREEKEERERRRRQEKRERSRPRKSSRSSAIEVTSLYSSHSIAPPIDNGFSVSQSPRLSGLSTRPTSSLTAPIDRQSSLGQVYSQASFSDAHSPASQSPRRSRFFSFRNMSGAWRSQDSLAPSGMSGSMIDMHVALQRENHASHLRVPADRLNSSAQRQSQLWPPPANGDKPPAATDDVPKKKKKHGFAKIWKLVKGSSTKDDVHVGNYDSVRPPERHDDDFPLTPPPPLSYLVERGPGEHFGGGGRHASTPSLPSTSSPWGGFSSPGMSPPTAPSSLLPSPTSSRPSGGNGDAVRISVHTDDNDVALAENTRVKLVHPVTSEPDIRYKLQQTPTNMTLPKSAARQHVVLSREKSLPPLPGEVKPRPQTLGSESRPQTLYTYDPRHNCQVPQELVSPSAPFHETRRQSFSGITSRPTLGIQTMPLGGYDYMRSPNGLYNEFGISRRSLGRLGNIDENPPVPPPPKRKSKFGFASLLGKKSNTTDTNGCSSHEFPRLSMSGYDGNEESLYSAYTSSRQSAGPRMSIMSRKAIEELVDQDRDFVAYRYPSQTQSPIDFIR
ncbi:hypothetical protein V8B97DRAFT_1865531 [Scleroderma yunnanense]